MEMSTICLTTVVSWSEEGNLQQVINTRVRESKPCTTGTHSDVHSSFPRSFELYKPKMHRSLVEGKCNALPFSIKYPITVQLHGIRILSVSLYLFF